jgi:hypothetical protein
LNSTVQQFTEDRICPYRFPCLHSFRRKALKRLELGYFNIELEGIRDPMQSLKGRLDHVTLPRLVVDEGWSDGGKTVWKGVLGDFKGVGLTSVSISF